LSASAAARMACQHQQQPETLQMALLQLPASLCNNLTLTAICMLSNSGPVAASCQRVACFCFLLALFVCVFRSPLRQHARPHASAPTSQRVYFRMCGSVHTCTRYRPLPLAQHCCGRDPAGCQCLAAAALSALPATKGTAHLQPFNKAACCFWVTTGVVAGHMRGSWLVLHGPA
jgi:hypothetical protein